MKPSSVAKALVCVAVAVIEVLPARSRRSLDNILRAVIADGLIDDRDTIRVLKYLIDDH